MTESEKQLPELKKRVLSAKQSRQHNFAFGAYGEERAVVFLKQIGYRVLDTNVRFRHCEIDIVALDPAHQEIVFIEVKTRRTAEFGHPTAAVSQKKIKSIAQVARAYMRTHHLPHDYRFDTIAVLPSGVEHFMNVSWGLG